MMSDATTAISVDPASGAWLASYPFLDASGIEAILRRAQEAYAAWRHSGLAGRCAVLVRMAGVLRADIEVYAGLITREMGKPLRQARAEVEKCAVLCEWYGHNAEDICTPQRTPIPGGKAYVSYLPIGPVLAVVPWHFPFWQVMRDAVPIIAGGNTYVLKPAPNVMGCAMALEQAWARAGLPEGVFENLNTSPAGVASAIADPRIVAVTVAGSAQAGAVVAAQAGAALKKSVLALGGSDPFIVLADADLARAVPAAVCSRFQNAGQAGIAGKRILVERDVAQAFTERFVAAVRKLRMGDPTRPETDIGPMACADLRDALDSQVRSSVADGAELLLGGKSVMGAGNFYEPTVLAGVTPSMRVFREETIGPVAAITVVNDAAEAMHLANLTAYGLSSVIWSRDVALAKVYARSIDAGGVFINGVAVSDPRVPVGGIKMSGYGRALSHFGMLEFMNAQTVWVGQR